MLMRQDVNKKFAHEFYNSLSMSNEYYILRKYTLVKYYTSYSLMGNYHETLVSYKLEVKPIKSVYK